MPHATIRAEMYRSPRRLVSDGRFTPEGTVQFQHVVSFEGQAQTFYLDRDLTESLNGVRDQLNKGVAVPLHATVDLVVAKAGTQLRLQAMDLVKLEHVKG